MKVLDVNSPEHRAFVIEAIKSKEAYLLRQLKFASKSGLSQLLLLESTLDALMFSSWEEENPDQYVIFTDKPFYEFLVRVTTEAYGSPE
ncbi:hypothetical protein [Pontibacter fetidus]|uniref:Uncharacterized protein n=1 Tax=Pontibacter fetidus TaxID=2700082 RepID=A0A6B2H8C0_9BACT|nr:hypothetical protein [Pontibacter fetidus]NDK56817.1 hypothetical protein [Pontibacter fetidus]